MMSSHKDKRITVQGADPPVPVGVGGDGTGHPRPSANDSPDPAVAHQGGAIIKATGTGIGNSGDGLGDGKGRRTMETRRLSSGPNMITIDLRQGDITPEKTLKHSRLNLLSQLRRCNSFDTGKKRKVLDTSMDKSVVEEDIIRRSEDPIAFVIREAIEMTINFSQDLDRKIVEIPNTKREIKEIVSKLKKSVEVLRRDSSKAWLEKHKWTFVPTPVYDVECQTDGKVDAAENDTQVKTLKTSTVATQTEKSAWQKRNDASAAKIREKINMVRVFEEFRETLNEEWPEEVFTIVREIEGNPLKDDIELNLGFWTGKEFRADEGIYRQVAKRFPDLMDLTDKERNGEEMVCLVYESRRFSKNGYDNHKRRTVTSIRMEDTENEIYNTLMEWREKLEEMDVRRVAIPVPERGWKKYKKIMEYTFRGSDITVMAYFLRDKKRQKKTVFKESRPVTGGDTPRKRVRTEEAVIINTAGKPYAEALRQVKQNINTDKIGITIRNARSTRNGELLLTIEKGGNGREALKDEIQRRLGDHGFQARISRRDNMVLHVKGLEATSTIEEAKRAIVGACGEEDTKIRLGPMRPAFGQTQNLTVHTDRETGEKLLKVGRVRIGWAICNVKERVEIRRCLRCWKTGHLVRECGSEENRTNCCLRCAKEGHMVKDCRNEPFCPLCNSIGHRADSTACPRFRSAVAEQANRKGVRLSRKATERQDLTPTDSDMEEEQQVREEHLSTPQMRSYEAGSTTLEVQTELRRPPDELRPAAVHHPND